MFLLQKYSRHKFIEVQKYRAVVFKHWGWCLLQEKRIKGKIFLTPYGIGNNKVWFRSWSMNDCNWVHKCSEYLVNLLNSNISIHILHTVRFTFPLVRIRRICLTIKAAKVGDHFLYSHDVNEWFSSITVRRN